MGDVNAATSDIGDRIRAVGTFYTERLDFNFGVTANCRSVDLWSYLHTLQTDGR